MERQGDKTVESATRAPEPGAPEPVAARTAPAKIQPVLMASLVAAIIVMIALGAFWTSF